MITCAHIVPLYSQWLLYVPLGLTLRNYTVKPNSVFRCFVWISEKNRDHFPVQSYAREIAFITEAKGVYCAVRDESLSITEVKRNNFVFTARYVMNL